jgi:hypothetical protein
VDIEARARREGEFGPKLMLHLREDGRDLVGVIEGRKGFERKPSVWNAAPATQEVAPERPASEASANKVSWRSSSITSPKTCR